MNEGSGADGADPLLLPMCPAFRVRRGLFQEMRLERITVKTQNVRVYTFRIVVSDCTARREADPFHEPERPVIDGGNG